MDLIILEGYTPPAPTTYDINYSDVNGEKSQVEDGTTYIEQVRADVPTIKVGWTNLTQKEVSHITGIVGLDVIHVSYYYGEMKSAGMTVGERSLKLKHKAENGDTYWDLSFTLEG